MCGIFGIVSKRDLPLEAMTQKGCDALSHRGPDGSGAHTAGPVSLGHRRLAIIDVAQGMQPMRSRTGRHVVTYNGEIYNHLELREELRRLGFDFKTHSDTETLLAAYEAWGTDCLERLRGMFAFAIADFERKEVFLARDRFGIKPLLYRSAPGFFAFSSELPPLAAMAGLPPLTLSAAAIMLFFRYQYIPSPHTVYTQIRKIRPAHALMVNFEGEILRQWRYWDFNFTPRPVSREEAVARVGAAVKDSVRAHTLSDVPIGVYLSGGIDSTLVAATLARDLGRTVPAFTIAFDEREFSELEHARTAARHLGLELHHTVLRGDSFAMLPEILAHYGEPYGDSSVLPTWEVARLARRHVAVVLSGDAGDELFGGYHSYDVWLEMVSRVRKNRIQEHVRQLRSGVKLTAEKEAAFQASLRPSASDWQAHMYGGFFLPAQAEAFFAPPLVPFAGAAGHVFGELHERHLPHDPLELAQFLDLKTYLPECLLPKVDVTSMWHGLEVRPALLDPVVCAEALRLPLEHKFTAEEKGKAVLKELLIRQGFSESFVFRKKMGFSIPERLWFLEGGPARRLLEDLLHDHEPILGEFFSVTSIRRLLRSHSPAHDVSRNLWLIMAFACWVNNANL